MTKESFKMSSKQLAKVVGTVGSPLIVIAELIKNAVDVSADQIDIDYDIAQGTISVENDHQGFLLSELKSLSQLGDSNKKRDKYMKNEKGQFLTGSKGLGLLSTFSLCDKVKIETTIDNIIYKVILDKESGSIEYNDTNKLTKSAYTKITMINVDRATIGLLQSENEIMKLRHITPVLYKRDKLKLPKILLHVGSQEPQEVSFTCTFPPMMYDVEFNYNRTNKELKFRCVATNKDINNSVISITDFSLDSLEKMLLTEYGVARCFPTKIAQGNNENLDFSNIPNFEGKIIVYEKQKAGEELKTYGAGVNFYINDFALYEYLSPENDWLELADFSQRIKNTRLKPHNVFGYINIPEFNENIEKLAISNERADFIKNVTYYKLMYLIKGVVLFLILDIDIADKNPGYKVKNGERDGDAVCGIINNSCDTKDSSSKGESNSSPNMEQDFTDTENDDSANESGEGTYKPKKAKNDYLDFSEKDGECIREIKGKGNLENKIYNVVYELSKLSCKEYPYAVAFLFRALIESATKKAANDYDKIKYDEKDLESSIKNALSMFGNFCGEKGSFSDKNIKTCRNAVKSEKVIDILNNYIHNDIEPDADAIKEKWKTMKIYIMMCLQIGKQVKK